MNPEMQNKAVDKILVALAKSYEHTILRNDIRSRVLDSQFSAAELSLLRDTHPLIQKFVTIDTSELGRNKKPVEKWVLRDEALKNQFELRHLFSYRTPPAEIFEEPKPVQPSNPPAAPPVAIEVPDVVDGFTTQALVLMPHSAFENLPEEQRRRLPRRSQEIDATTRRADIEAEVWARFEREQDFWPQKNNKPILPKEYFGTDAEVQARSTNAMVVEQYTYGTSRVTPIFRTPDGLLHKYGSTNPVIVGVTHRVVVDRTGGKVKGVLLDSEGMKCHVIRIKVNQPTPRHRVELIDGKMRWTDAPPPPQPSLAEVENTEAPVLDCMKGAHPTTRLTLKDAAPSMKLVTGSDGTPEWRTVEATLTTADYVPSTFTAAERAASRANRVPRVSNQRESYDPVQAYLANKDAC